MGGHHSAYHRELCPGVLRGHEDCFWLCVWGGPPWPGGCLADTASELPGQQLLLHRQKGRWAAKHGAGGARRQEKSCRSTLARGREWGPGPMPSSRGPSAGCGQLPARDRQPCRQTLETSSSGLVHTRSKTGAGARTTGRNSPIFEGPLGTDSRKEADRLGWVRGWRAGPHGVEGWCRWGLG